MCVLPHHRACGFLTILNLNTGYSSIRWCLVETKPHAFRTPSGALAVCVLWFVRSVVFPILTSSVESEPMTHFVKVSGFHNEYFSICCVPSDLRIRKASSNEGKLTFKAFGTVLARTNPLHGPSRCTRGACSSATSRVGFKQPTMPSGKIKTRLCV